MTYVSNHTNDIAMKARQRAALEAEYKAYIKQRRPVTVAPGFPSTPKPLPPGRYNHGRLQHKTHSHSRSAAHSPVPVL